jgi:hypothetical protein
MIAVNLFHIDSLNFSSILGSFIALSFQISLFGVILCFLLSSSLCFIITFTKNWSESQLGRLITPTSCIVLFFFIYQYMINLINSMSCSCTFVYCFMLEIGTHHTHIIFNRIRTQAHHFHYFLHEVNVSLLSVTSVFMNFGNAVSCNCQQIISRNLRCTLFKFSQKLSLSSVGARMSIMGRL